MTTRCTIDLTSEVASSDVKKKLALRQAQALLTWVETFTIPSLHRKSKFEVHVTNPEPGKLVVEGDEAQLWQKSIHSALKKVICEDLGNMDAEELLPTIPESDPEGRGIQDIMAMEKKFSVKVVFDNQTGHIFLVGDSKKLEKKCFVLRNMLSHYHWRHSGRDVSFSK